MVATCPQNTKERSVFRRTGNNTYYLNNVQGHTDLIGQVGSFQVMTANEKISIASCIAYALNLKGPAVMYRRPVLPLCWQLQKLLGIRKGHNMALRVACRSPFRLKVTYLQKEHV
jgi:hypothetical protein